MRDFLDTIAIMLVPALMATAAWSELDKALRRDAPWMVILVRLLFCLVSLGLVAGGFWLVVQVDQFKGVR